MRRAHLFLFLFLLTLQPLAAQRGPAAPSAQRGPAAPSDLAARARGVLAQTSGRIQAPGLQKPVTVLRDPWGVPHIFAETQDDLFFAQGFVAAQDRLWQMEIWRRTGEGKLAEVLGPGAVERDRFARLLRYRGDMETEYASYAPDAKQIIAAFVRGVNFFIESSRDRLPIEFQLTGIRPEPWTPEVCLTRMAGYIMTLNAGYEVERALVAREMGTALADEMIKTEPPRKLEVPPGLDLAGIDYDILALAQAAGAPLAFEKRRDGSNNWVVDGTLSASGKPLLANDPHRTIALPSLRYLTHLVGPGWNVIGAGEPALPGVAAGHNDRAAFGFTIVGIDQQDLYVAETHPRNPNRYRYRGKWERMRVEREVIRVQGKDPVEVELKFTAHGPVIHEDRKRRRAWSLRWVGSEPGTAGYLASLSLNRARSWPEFLAALDRWKVPSENLVYADVDGNIGWKAAGLTPVRKGWSGLLPVPGDGRYEWQGFLPMSELPVSFNPPEHFLATANHNILPPGYPHELGYDWAPPDRFQRLAEVLRTPGRKYTVADFERLQHDERSNTACEAVRLLASAASARGVDEALRPHVERLSRWDCVLDVDSGEAALYQLWKPRLAPAVFKPRLPEEHWKMLRDRLGFEEALEALRTPAARWFGDDPAAGRDAVLVATLRDAVAETREKLGDDPAKWRWGALHKAPFTHVLSTDEARKTLFNLPSPERGGDGTTVNSTGGRGLLQTHGASFREILDLADWDRSVATNVPGQSGQPGSPHYADLLPLWAEGRYFPLLFSREKIEEVAKERLVLEPAE